jgi:hypothetical protein
MNRQREFARLAAAGWQVQVDSPWRRAAAGLFRVPGAVMRMVARPVRRPA